MSRSFIIAGTDTNVGKTVLSSLLMAANEDLSYWKPIQSGLEEETDSEVVRRLSECSIERIKPEAYKLQRPLSPHLSARLDGITIENDKLTLPKTENIIVEAAGGVLVPINEDTLQIDLIKMWSLPVIIAARSSLGTINHTLLTIEALRKREIEIAGVVMIGDLNEENEKAITIYGEVEIFGRIPMVKELNKKSWIRIYNENFKSMSSRGGL
jgi:dethiobiotin synthetase